ncbi:MAG: GNAT family N-acetyltransferase [Crocinitomix sp.]|nr:GNAT family N-acetyltransferase [Crocinitomix sp.]
MSEIKIINPNIPAELAHFYAVGRAVRESIAYQEIDWSDDHGLDQIIGEKNLEFRIFTAKSSEGIGRIAAIKYKEQEEGIIGWFECSNSQSLSDSLLNAAIDFLKTKACKKVIGPINGSTWNNYRFNKTAEQPLLPGEPFQPLYYVRLWETFGFKEYSTYETTLAPNDLFEPMTMAEGQELAEQFNLKVVFYPAKPSPEFLDKMYDFYHACFQTNPLFHPIEKEAYHKLSGKFAQILNAEHSLLVTDNEDNPIAVTLTYNDVYHAYYEAGKIKNPLHAKKRLLIKTIATHPEWQGKQIGTLMINLVHNLANESGYKEIYHLLMFNHNLSATKGKEKFVTKKVREYAIYAMAI